MQIQVSKITVEDGLQPAWDIRVKVFVEEQGVDSDLEYEHEHESHHFIAYADGAPAGTARWRRTANGIKLERFAVLPPYRGRGVAAALLKAILADVGETADKIYLHAQTPVVGFYEKYGFARVGAEFEEAGIPHYMMVRRSVV